MENFNIHFQLSDGREASIVTEARNPDEAVQFVRSTYKGARVKKVKVWRKPNVTH